MPGLVCSTIGSLAGSKDRRKTFMRSSRLPRYVRFLELTEIGLAFTFGVIFRIYYDCVIIHFDFEHSRTTALVLSFQYWVSLGLLCFALHEALTWYPPTRDNPYLHGGIVALGFLELLFAISEGMQPLVTGTKWLT